MAAQKHKKDCRGKLFGVFECLLTRNPTFYQILTGFSKGWEVFLGKIFYWTLGTEKGVILMIRTFSKTENIITYIKVKTRMTCVKKV